MPVYAKTIRAAGIDIDKIFCHNEHAARHQHVLSMRCARRAGRDRGPADQTTIGQAAMPL
jgi:hypothetical protein